MGIHMPKEIIGPHQLDLVERDIRKHFFGELRLAHDLMNIVI